MQLEQLSESLPEQSKIKLISLYVALEKDRDFKQTLEYLHQKPNYAHFIYDDLGGLDQVIYLLSNPINIKKISKLLSNEIKNYNFLLNWTKDKVDDNYANLILSAVNKIRRGKEIKFTDVIRNPKGTATLTKQHGGVNNMLKFLSSPDGISELSRLWENTGFSADYIFHLIK